MTTTPVTSPARLTSAGTPHGAIPTPVREQAVLRTPHHSHSITYVNAAGKCPGGRAKVMRGLRTKALQTLVAGTFTPDMDVIRREGRRPDRRGEVRVTPNVYQIHPKNQPDGTNRLIPIRGPGMTTLTGPEAAELLDRVRSASLTAGIASGGGMARRTLFSGAASTTPSTPATLSSPSTSLAPA